MTNNSSKGHMICFTVSLEPNGSVLSHTRENVARAKCARCGVLSIQSSAVPSYYLRLICCNFLLASLGASSSSVMFHIDWASFQMVSLCQCCFCTRRRDPPRLSACRDSMARVLHALSTLSTTKHGQPHLTPQTCNCRVRNSGKRN